MMPATDPTFERIASKAMKLTGREKAMLERSAGAATQKAMDLLVRYAEALGADQFVETNSFKVTKHVPFLKRIGLRSTTVCSLLASSTCFSLPISG